jgi:hypothetical protein
MSSSSEAAKYVRDKTKIAKAQGWKVEPYTDGTKFTPPDKSKPVVRVHRTPSDSRWMKNKDKEFRDSGLVF